MCGPCVIGEAETWDESQREIGDAMTKSKTGLVLKGWMYKEDATSWVCDSEKLYDRAAIYRTKKRAIVMLGCTPSMIIQVQITPWKGRKG